MNSSTSRAEGSRQGSPFFSPMRSLGIGRTSGSGLAFSLAVQSRSAMSRPQRQMDVRDQLGRRGVARGIEILLDAGRIRRLAAGLRQPGAVEKCIGAAHVGIGPL